MSLLGGRRSPASDKTNSGQEQVSSLRCRCVHILFTYCRVVVALVTNLAVNGAVFH